MTTSTGTFQGEKKQKTSSNFSAWQQLTGIEKKARGVLGVSRLKAHVGRLDLDSGFVLFWLSGSIDTSYINLSNTIKNPNRELDGDDRWAELV